MKKLATIGVVVFLFFGCAGPRFSSESQYDRGEWKGNAYLNEVAQIKHDKAKMKFDDAVGSLALKKLEAQPVDAKSVNGVKQGYKGIVQNFSRDMVQIIIRNEKGYEIKSYALGPRDSINDNDRDEDYLLPGDYCAVFIINGRPQKDVKKFTVTSRTFRYFGKDYHWYAYQPE